MKVCRNCFLEKPLEQQLKTIREGKLENFITFIANIQLKSNSSLYTAVYRKPMSRSRELFIEHVDYSDDTKPFNEDLFECINNNLKLIPEEYHDALLGISLEGEAESKFVKKLGLTTIQFRKQMKEYVTLIQNKCEHCL